MRYEDLQNMFNVELGLPGLASNEQAQAQFAQILKWAIPNSTPGRFYLVWDSLRDEDRPWCPVVAGTQFQIDYGNEGYLCGKYGEGWVLFGEGCTGAMAPQAMFLWGAVA